MFKSRRLVTKQVRSQLQQQFAQGRSISTTTTTIDDATVKNHFQHQPKGVSHLFGDLVIDRAQGSWLYNDTTGEKYLDFTCGIGVTNTGHCHPK